MKYLVTYFAVLAGCVIVAGPAMANPPCRSCPPKKATIPPKPQFRDRFVPVNVPYPYPVPYQAPTNLVATIFPQPTYNTSVTVTTPTVAAPQAVQFQVTQPGTAPVFGVPYGQAPHAPSAVPLSTEARLDRLEVALGQLCETLKVTNTVKAPEPVRTPGLPRVLGSKCAICHTPAKAKGEFVLFDKGQLAALTAKDFARMHRYVAANKCPPANNPENVVPLDDAEKSELLDWISKQPK